MPEHESETWTADPVASRAPARRPIAVARPGHGLAEAILDAVVEGIIVLDPDSGRVVDLNRGAEVLLDRSRDQVIGRPIADLIRRSDADRLAGFIDQVASGRRTTSTVMTEVQPANGPSISVEVVLQAITLQDGSRAIVAIARDISERIEVQVRLQRLAQAEHSRAAELNAVIRTMGEGVIVCAPDGRISLTNPAAERLFPEVANQTYQEILGRLHDPSGLAPRLGSRTGPVELPFAADPEQWVELATYPVTVGIGLATAGDETIVVIRDVTDARRREAIRETFIGVLSHELRTPVTTIFGGAKLLARENTSFDEETRRGIFQDIYEEAERLQRLVEDVVALNRFSDDRGDDRLGTGPHPASAARRGGLRGEPVAGRVLRHRRGVRTADRQRGDPTYVEQVVRNLLSNAAKYGGAGSTVTVTAVAAKARCSSASSTTALVSRPTRRPACSSSSTARRARPRRPSGAGIGLFVCARLIAAMGGRIWASPRPEGGAEFGFSLHELDDE